MFIRDKREFYRDDEEKDEGRAREDMKVVFLKNKTCTEEQERVARFISRQQLLAITYFFTFLDLPLVEITVLSLADYPLDPISLPLAFFTFDFHFFGSFLSLPNL